MSPFMEMSIEPIFEADFQPGSYGYRPKRTAHEAVNRVAGAIVQQKTCVIDLDLRAYFDTVRHHLLLDKVALRVQDDDVMHLLRLILKASGKLGVPQGGMISPLLSNIYLTAVDTDERDVETELWRGYSGTARRKRRQQTNRTYCHRATFLLYRVLPLATGGFGAVQSKPHFGGLSRPRLPLTAPC